MLDITQYLPFSFNISALREIQNGVVELRLLKYSDAVEHALTKAESLEQTRLEGKQAGQNLKPDRANGARNTTRYYLPRLLPRLLLLIITYHSELTSHYLLFTVYV